MNGANKATIRGLTIRAKNTLRDQLVRFLESKRDLSGNEQMALSILQADERLTLTVSDTHLALQGVDQQGKFSSTTLHLV
jgi:hypothetical protein